MEKAKKISIRKYGIYMVFVITFILLSFVNKSFFTLGNILTILKQASVVSVLAIGTTFVLISGGLDLSSSAIAALAGVCSAKFGLPGDTPIIVAFLVALLIGLFIGFLNGLIVSYMYVPPFITTLGMSIIVRGLALIVTNAKPVFGLSNQYIFLGSGKLFGIPVIILVMLFVLLVAYIILEKTKFGRHVYAVGGNEISSHVSGINVKATKIMVYTIAGILSGLAGILLAGRIQSGTPVMGEGLELDAIAGAVIGGVSTSGGIGKVYGTIIGVLFLSMITNGLDLLQVSPYYQQIIKGAIIILAVFFDVRSNQSPGNAR